MNISSNKTLLGRPRDPETDLKIIEATIDMICEAGYSGTTIEAVATKAGVGRPTIYRRYSNRETLAIAATRHLFMENMPEIKSVENGREEVIALLRSTVHMLTKTRVGPIFRMMIPYFPHKPTFQNLANELGQLRRTLLSKALNRAQQEGFIPKDRDIKILGDGINGAVYFTFIKNQKSLTNKYVIELFEGLRK